MNLDDLIKIAQDGIEEKENTDWMFNEKIKKLAYKAILKEESLEEVENKLGTEFVDKIISETVADILCSDEEVNK